MGDKIQEPKFKIGEQVFHVKHGAMIILRCISQTYWSAPGRSFFQYMAFRDRDSKTIGGFGQMLIEEDFFKDENSPDFIKAKLRILEQEMVETKESLEALRKVEAASRSALGFKAQILKLFERKNPPTHPDRFFYRDGK